MILKKSMISIAAATLLAAGFTACDTTSDTTSTVVNAAPVTTQQIVAPKGTVTGLVQDTNGNPIANVKVYLADRNATTNLGGMYTFLDVPVTSTSGTSTVNSPIVSQTLSVTIAAPTGYLGATVTVTPSAQIDSSEGTDGGATTGGVETFIDGYLAQAGTAVLPQLNAAVTGTLRDTATGSVLANTKINLDLTTGGTIVSAQPQVQNGVATTYAVSNYSATTDANGMFSFANIPSDAAFTAVAPGYGALVGACVAFNTNAEDALELGNCTTTAIVANDAITPFVASVTGQIGNAGPRQMLEDNVRQNFTINFSEAMVIESDKDYTNSVIVKAGKKLSLMNDQAATVTIAADKKSITVSTPAPLTDATLLDIHLLVTDFKDAAGNFIALAAGPQVPNVGYDSVAAAGQTLLVQLQIFNDLNTAANAVATIAQQTVDTHGTVNDAKDLQALNNAFNDTRDSGTPDFTISQLNAPEAAARLNALGDKSLALPTGTMNVITNEPRVTFTPTGAVSYDFMVTRNNVDQNFNNANVVIEGAAVVATVGVGLTGTAIATSITPADPSSVTPIEFRVLAANGLLSGDVITVTPFDELGYHGTAKTITLVDNVAPTTVLQKSYALGLSTDTGNTVVQFGDGGELSDSTGSIKAGTPYLAITAGLLDNKDALGAAVTGVVPSDNTLSAELNEKSNAALKIANTDMYDTIAWAAFNTTRTMGVAFSENIDLNGTTPTTTNVSTALSSWKVNNDVKINDDGLPFAPVNVDLVDFTVANVITLANADNGGVIDFTGIQDASVVPNKATAASNAKVIVQDKMPAFVETASYNGTSVIITFNEAMGALTAGDTIHVLNSFFVSRTAAYAVANAAKYVFSADKKTLTIDATEFPGLTRADFDIGAAYVESAYGTVKRNHAMLVWDSLKDARGNNWTAQSAGVVPPRFAAADLIGAFDYATNKEAFLGSANSSTTAQTVVWTLTHPVRTTTAGDFMNGVALSASGYVLDGAVVANLVTINTWFEGTVSGISTPITQVAGQGTSVILSADKTTITFKFTTKVDTAATDTVRTKLAPLFTVLSAIDATAAAKSLSASAK